MANEKTNTDQLVRRFIEELNVSYEEQTSSNVQIKEALKNASKSKDSRGVGKPEFIFFSGNHLFIIEDKLSVDKLEYKNDSGEVDTDCLWQDKPTYNCSAKVHNSASSLGQKKKPLRAS